MVRLVCLWLLVIAMPAAAAQTDSIREDARSIEHLVNQHYAYPERLPVGKLQLSAKLKAEADNVTDKRSLLRFAERALFTLADHHAITGASFPDSWAVVPSYSDLWIEKRGPDYVVDAVRSGSPAQAAGIRKGDVLATVAGVPADRAVAAFWEDLGLAPTEARAAFAARVLAAGRRDRQRALSFRRGTETARQLLLPSLYSLSTSRPPVSVAQSGRDLTIKINDSLGDSATIAAFDEAMGQAKPRQRIVLDLTDTPSGGNTVVARAIMGWFVARPSDYQVHRLPAEERQSGIPRQWIEQVLPRAGKHHKGPVMVRVGRWTGSMGEGLAIGFDALGATVVGDRMAGLLGAIYDYKLPASGLVLKIPTERLMAVNGLPREEFVPRRAP
jgi:carboxyl-terminal processing protease